MSENQEKRNNLVYLSKEFVKFELLGRRSEVEDLKSKLKLQKLHTFMAYVMALIYGFIVSYMNCGTP